MQGAWKNAIAELSRSVGASVVCWSARSDCYCNCNYPEPIICPPCVCEGHNRAPVLQETGYPCNFLLFSVGVAFIIGYLVGVIAARPVPLRPSPVVLRPPGGATVDLAQEAAAQLAVVRQRDGAGARWMGDGPVRRAGAATVA